MGKSPLHEESAMRLETGLIVVDPDSEGMYLLLEKEGKFFENWLCLVLMGDPFWIQEVPGHVVAIAEAWLEAHTREL